MKHTANEESPVALISGGLGDIATAITRLLLQNGYRVALADLKSNEEAESHLRKFTPEGRVYYTALDVSRPEAVSAWVREITQQWGTPWLAVPNAATFTQESLLRISPDAWRRELQVNLDGAFHLAQAAAVAMREKNQAGRIVFVGSWAGHVPHPHVPVYSVSKAGLRMLMQCLAAELAPCDILVNEVAPGYVNAGLSAQLFREHPARAAAARARVPVRKLIEPEEVARQVLALSDPQNHNQTGSVVVLDGGLSLGPLSRREADQ